MSIFAWAVEKNKINYLYFGLLFLGISVFSITHVLSMEAPFSLYFLLCSFGQSLLETAAFLAAASLLSSWTLYILISFSFVAVLLHFANFTMVRILDSSIVYLFKFLFGSGIGHIFTAFQALNMNLGMILLSTGLIILIPLIGIVFYRITLYASNRKPLQLSFFQIFLLIASVSLFLLLLDLFASSQLTRASYVKYEKALPLGTTFFAPPKQCIALPSPIAPPRDETKLPPLCLAAKPNLYFFVIETLRKDFLHSKTAPHLTAFASQNIQFPHSFANATATHLSWFALFHSDSPYHWAAQRDRWKKGSPALQLLKSAGYKIHVYSSADLRFFGLDRLIFGERRELADRIEEYSFNRLIEPWERDALAFRSFERDLSEEGGREGNLFLFFLDATHSEYSFPPSLPLQFEPISNQIDYLTLTEKDIEPLKNRYRNSIFYVDSLMGIFFDTLKRQGLYDDAVIAITGDHGEEFFEDGALFHATHLNSYQTSVPIYLKFQDNSWTPRCEMATHIDIFPSLLHFLAKKNDFSPLFDGQSIFDESRNPYRIAVLQNGPDTPVEFTLENGRHRIAARFLSPRNIHKQTRLEILSLEAPHPLPDEPYEILIRDYFSGALEPLLKNSPAK